MISDVYILIFLFFLFFIFFLFVHLSIIFRLILKKKIIFGTSWQFCQSASFRTRLRCLLSYFFKVHPLDVSATKLELIQLQTNTNF